MARDVQKIITQMDDAQALQPVLTSLNSPSQTAIFKLWKYITALVQVLHEILWDSKKVELESIVATAPVGGDLWLQKGVKEFQYDSLVPQVVKLNTTTMAVGYDPIDESKRIITRCSVKTTAARIVTVKVAKSEPPVALSGTELSALQDYLTIGGDGTYANRGVGIGFAGTQIVASSAASDKFFLKAEISYDGQYAAVIQQNVIDAINAYFAAIPFDGILKINSLVDAIQNVSGVEDIIIEDAAIRANATAFGSKTYLIQSFTELFSQYPMFAGYVEEEDTPGEDFATQLTFTAV